MNSGRVVQVVGPDDGHLITQIGPGEIMQGNRRWRG